MHYKYWIAAAAYAAAPSVLLLLIGAFARHSLSLGIPSLFLHSLKEELSLSVFVLWIIGCLTGWKFPQEWRERAVWSMIAASLLAAWAVSSNIHRHPYPALDVLFVMMAFLSLALGARLGARLRELGVE